MAVVFGPFLLLDFAEEHRQEWLCHGTIFGTQSASWRIVSLAGRIGFGKFLRSLPPRAQLGLGNLLACRRILQLDHRPVDPGNGDDPRSASRLE